MIIYKDETSTFDELLKKMALKSYRNIHALAIEIYNIRSELAPDFKREIFPQRNLINLECVARNLCTQVDFYNTANPKSTKYGLETLRHLCPIVWNAFPKAIRNSLF